MDGSQGFSTRQVAYLVVFGHRERRFIGPRATGIIGRVLMAGDGSVIPRHLRLQRYGNTIDTPEAQHCGSHFQLMFQLTTKAPAAHTQSVSVVQLLDKAQTQCPAVGSHAVRSHVCRLTPSADWPHDAARRQQQGCWDREPHPNRK